jgi:hypothetical protein
VKKLEQSAEWPKSLRSKRTYIEREAGMELDEDVFVDTERRPCALWMMSPMMISCGA